MQERDLLMPDLNDHCWVGVVNQRGERWETYCRLGEVGGGLHFALSPAYAYSAMDYVREVFGGARFHTRTGDFKDAKLVFGKATYDRILHHTTALGIVHSDANPNMPPFGWSSAELSDRTRQVWQKNFTEGTVICYVRPRTYLAGLKRGVRPGGEVFLVHIIELDYLKAYHSDKGGNGLKMAISRKHFRPSDPGEWLGTKGAHSSYTVGVAALNEVGPQYNSALLLRRHGDGHLICEFESGNKLLWDETDRCFVTIPNNGCYLHGLNIQTVANRIVALGERIEYRELTPEDIFDPRYTAAAAVGNAVEVGPIASITDQGRTKEFNSEHPAMLAIKAEHKRYLWEYPDPEIAFKF